MEESFGVAPSRPAKTPTPPPKPSAHEAIHLTSRRCHVDIAPQHFYKITRTKHKASSTDKTGVTRVIDDAGVPWVMKEYMVEDATEVAVRNEVQALRLQMPCHLFLHEVFWTASRMYIVLPELRHGNLARFCTEASTRRGRCLQRFRDIAAQVALGIWGMHQRGLIHRDISARNVMLLDSDAANVTLIDYDRAVAGCRERNGESCTRDPDVGHLAFGMDSTSNGAGYSYELDWWSFGSLLYYLLYMEEPFAGFEGLDAPAFEPAVQALHDPAFDELLRVTIGRDFWALETEAARLAMESPKPELHPIMSMRFWLHDKPYTNENRTEALREFWRGVCVAHAYDAVSQCADLFEPKSAASAPDLAVPICGGGGHRGGHAARCCCKRSACARNSRGDLMERGVDLTNAVETPLPDGTALCCRRQMACKGGFRDPNTTFKHAPCFHRSSP